MAEPESGGLDAARFTINMLAEVRVDGIRATLVKKFFLDKIGWNASKLCVGTVIFPQAQSRRRIPMNINPKYNGSHACPQCGTLSSWTCVSEAPIVIRVDCEGSCGAYEKTFLELQSMPFFEKPVKQVAAHR